MATMTLSLVVGASTYTKTVTLSNANAGRLQAAYSALYEGGTAAEVFDKLAAGIFQGMKDNALSQERAAQQPIVADIPLT